MYKFRILQPANKLRGISFQYGNTFKICVISKEINEISGFIKKYYKQQTNSKKKTIYYDTETYSKEKQSEKQKTRWQNLTSSSVSKQH